MTRRARNHRKQTPGPEPILLGVLSFLRTREPNRKTSSQIPIFAPASVPNPYVIYPQYHKLQQSQSEDENAVNLRIASIIEVEKEKNMHQKNHKKTEKERTEENQNAGRNNCSNEPGSPWSRKKQNRKSEKANLQVTSYSHHVLLQLRQGGRLRIEVVRGVER